MVLTLAEKRKKCKEQGKVLDSKTKRCRKSKRGGRKSKSKKTSRKRKSSRRRKSGLTLAEKRKKCREQGKVLDSVTKEM